MSGIGPEEIGADPQCSGYTGADLSALVKEASVQALAEFIAKEDKTQIDLSVNRSHIMKAFAKIRPSVSERVSFQLELQCKNC